MQAPNFETFILKNGSIDACYLNTTLGSPCGQGSVPVVGVDARSVKDVQAAVAFASKHNLRLVVKNTGYENISFCGIFIEVLHKVTITLVEALPVEVS